jgi:hypothetical protein
MILFQWLKSQLKQQLGQSSKASAAQPEILSLLTYFSPFSGFSCSLYYAVEQHHNSRKRLQCSTMYYANNFFLLSALGRWLFDFLAFCFYRRRAVIADHMHMLHS